jgi:hypothetical protein
MIRVDGSKLLFIKYLHRQTPNVLPFLHFLFVFDPKYVLLFPIISHSVRDSGPKAKGRGPTRSRVCGEETQKREDCDDGKHSIEAGGAERDFLYLGATWMLLSSFGRHGVRPG